MSFGEIIVFQDMAGGLRLGLFTGGSRNHGVEEA